MREKEEVGMEEEREVCGRRKRRKRGRYGGEEMIEEEV